MSRFDDAVQAHMAHPAGSMQDVLTECFFDQMACGRQLDPVEEQQRAAAAAASAKVIRPTWPRAVHEMRAARAVKSGSGFEPTQQLRERGEPRSGFEATHLMSEGTETIARRRREYAVAHARGEHRGYVHGVRAGRLAGFCWGVFAGCAAVVLVLRMGLGLGG